MKYWRNWWQILGCRRVNHYCVFLQKNKKKVTQWKAFVITRESFWNQNNTIASRWGIWRATGWTHICNHCKRGFIDYTMFQDYHPARFKWTLSKKTKKRQWISFHPKSAKKESTATLSPPPTPTMKMRRRRRNHSTEGCMGKQRVWLDFGDVLLNKLVKAY